MTKRRSEGVWSSANSKLEDHRIGTVFYRKGGKTNLNSHSSSSSVLVSASAWCRGGVLGTSSCDGTSNLGSIPIGVQNFFQTEGRTRLMMMLATAVDKPAHLRREQYVLQMSAKGLFNRFFAHPAVKRSSFVITPLNHVCLVNNPRRERC